MAVTIYYAELHRTCNTIGLTLVGNRILRNFSHFDRREKSKHQFYRHIDFSHPLDMTPYKDYKAI